MVCMDTDFLVALLRGDSDAQGRADEMDREDVRKATTPINAFELFLGAYLSERRDANLTLVRELLSNLELLDFDLRSCEKAGSNAAGLTSRGEPIGIRDSMIAGIASRFEETLLTRNIEHFSRVKELKVEKW